MAGFSPNCVALFALFCLVCFSGCKDPEKEKALADAEAVGCKNITYINLPMTDS